MSKHNDHSLIYVLHRRNYKELLKALDSFQEAENHQKNNILKRGSELIDLLTKDFANQIFCRRKDLIKTEMDQRNKDNNERMTKISNVWDELKLKTAKHTNIID